ncbi:MAG: hypothetical protein OEM59_10080 [Rhodospirillales bacterium]|nr:hypothetical protein [Rhodospirillales bacterium]
MALMERALSPLGGMLLLFGLYAADSTLMAYHGAIPSEEAQIAYGFGFPLFLAWWVYNDRRRHGYPAPYEFEAFVFFAWPLMVPYYLLKTRGIRAVPACLAVAGILFFPELFWMLAFGIAWP